MTRTCNSTGCRRRVLRAGWAVCGSCFDRLLGRKPGNGQGGPL